MPDGSQREIPAKPSPVLSQLLSPRGRGARAWLLSRVTSSGFLGECCAIANGVLRNWEGREKKKYFFFFGALDLFF